MFKDNIHSQLIDQLKSQMEMLQKSLNDTSIAVNISDQVNEPLSLNLLYIYYNLEIWGFQFCTTYSFTFINFFSVR